MNTLSQQTRRFKREVSKAGIFQDMRKHRHFETQDRKIQAQKTCLAKAG